MKSTQWAFCCWSSAEVVPPHVLRSHDTELVCKWKTDYPPSTVRLLVSGLNRELQRNGALLSVLDKSDGRFQPLLKTLDSLSCELHKAGIGAINSYR